MDRVLKAFNRKVDIIEATHWDRATILQRLALIRADPAGYNVEAASRASLNDVVDNINTLVNQNRVFLASPLAVSYQGTYLQHESVFDLIGWIFSVTGFTPPQATKSNYFYPLLALYTYFCRMLCSEEQYEPQMVQMTWFTEESISRVAVGANLDKPGRRVKNQARERRCQNMINYGWLTQQEMNLSFVKLPNGSHGQLFGHCAESFPFLYIQIVKNKSGRVDVQHAEGLAVRPAELLPEFRTQRFDYAERELERAGANPCANCSVLIPKLGMVVNNFRRPG